jgi:outer membrane protein assembly factor BamA
VAGLGIKAYLNTRYGNYTDLTLGYHSPVIINTSFVHTVQAFYRERHYFIYEDKYKVNDLDIVRSGVDFAFGYQWFRFGDTYLRYRYATDTTEETLGVNPPKNSTHIASFAFLTTVDNRDTGVFPHSGLLFKGSYEIAEPGYGSSTAFTKAFAYAQGNVPLGERHTIILEGSGGIGSGNLPYQEKFGIGGADYLLGIPLMGYQRREFVGEDELGISLAYRWKIKDYQLKAMRAVYLNLAGQAANVWNSRKEMSLNNLRNGVGIGLHADTIIGPVKFDYAVGEQHRYTVYFSAGFDF